jgi:formylglycine-generating enzyme required for sulfatase activity
VGYFGGGCNGTGTGNTTAEPGRGASEELSYVRLTRDFEISQFEITQGEWAEVFGVNPSTNSTCGSQCPMETVTWFGLLAYANALSVARGLAPCYDITGCSDGTAEWGTLTGCQVVVLAEEGNPYNCVGYRLPMEAEWEYVARAGSSSVFYPSPGNDGSIKYLGTTPLDPNLDQIAWYGGNGGGTTHPGGEKAPNAWGLYDTSGNVKEWVWDRYVPRSPRGSMTNPDVDPLWPSSDDYRVWRGGDYGYAAKGCRSAYHSLRVTSTRSPELGARLVRSLSGTTSGMYMKGGY